MVINIDATVRAIRKAKTEAEKMAGHSVNAAFASIGGEHVSGLNSHGNVALRAGEVGKEELELALEAARAVPLTSDEKILHVMPQEYIIDPTRWHPGTNGHVRYKARSERSRCDLRQKRGPRTFQNAWR